jgi:hypothetical protein
MSSKILINILTRVAAPWTVGTNEAKELILGFAQLADRLPSPNSPPLLSFASPQPSYFDRGDMLSEAFFWVIKTPKSAPEV